ncbi:hypothetical protein RU97_GL000429 [Enterococcus canis]|uniref:Uncharacterized protein n=1 Tax=Enterococcus canis TaxID=214095 RepID=A0A1L8RKA8_9ENTE|nr:hypothetical protein RU97_GL000429 [Enterococcus canis]
MKALQTKKAHHFFCSGPQKLDRWSSFWSSLHSEEVDVLFLLSK